jgi:MFS family permease
VPRREIVSAMAWLSIPGLFAPLMGPPLGGFITTYFHWRAIFWLNVPIGIIGLIFAALVVPQVRGDELRPLDFVGFFLSGLGFSLVIFGVTLSGRNPADAPIAFGMMAVGALLVGLYIVHARRARYPLLDLTLLRVATFRIALLGGTMFRIAAGAIPFLLPLMLQIGFGLSPFESGSLTFAAAAGALTMKFTASPILRHFGFRRILVANALISALLMAASGLFTAHTPHLMIIVVLLIAGFFRSMQFTSINALAYADIDNAAMSRATSFAAVIQQLSMSFGVALAALLLEGSQTWDGRSTLITADFARTFFVIGGLSSLSVFAFMKLRADAGAEVSGHVPKR